MDVTPYNNVTFFYLTISLEDYYSILEKLKLVSNHDISIYDFVQLIHSL